MNRLSPRSQKQQLKQEIWFHGSVSRSEAESMLTRVNISISLNKDFLSSNMNLMSIFAILFCKDGDFLVRESQGSPGQYVLTGMNNNTPKHLLLIDPEGVVSIA